MEAREILTRFKQNEITLEEAERYFRKKSFEEMEYAKLDSYREIRSGFPEVIFCSGKDVYKRQMRYCLHRAAVILYTEGLQE